MHIYSNHSGFFDQCLMLCEEEMENPDRVISEFFEEFHLSDVREHLAQLVEIALITQNNYFQDARERDKILWFTRRLEMLAEAANLLERRVNYIKIEVQETKFNS